MNYELPYELKSHKFNKCNFTISHARFSYTYNFSILIKVGVFVALDYCTANL